MVKNFGPTFCLAIVASGIASAANPPQITLEVKDYASMPITGAVDGKGNNASLLARVNFLREEPGVAKETILRQ
jgi:hypothetical protein